MKNIIYWALWHKLTWTHVFVFTDLSSSVLLYTFVYIHCLILDKGNHLCGIQEIFFPHFLSSILTTNGNYKLRQFLRYRARGSAFDSFITRVTDWWCKFKDLAPLLVSKDLPLGAKGRLDSAYARSVMLYESEAGPVKEEDVMDVQL